MLRAFEERDAELVVSAGTDALIPLITTVPAGASRRDALGFIERQHDRLRSGAGYSFAIADAVSGEAVGQIGLWLHDIEDGRATTGYWVGPDNRRRGHLTSILLRPNQGLFGLWSMVTCGASDNVALVGRRSTHG